jgi:hypothetical protein
MWSITIGERAKVPTQGLEGLNSERFLHYSEYTNERRSSRAIEIKSTGIFCTTFSVLLKCFIGRR